MVLWLFNPRRRILNNLLDDGNIEDLAREAGFRKIPLVGEIFDASFFGYAEFLENLRESPFAPAYWAMVSNALSQAFDDPDKLHDSDLGKFLFNWGYKHHDRFLDTAERLLYEKITGQIISATSIPPNVVDLEHHVLNAFLEIKTEKQLLHELLEDAEKAHAGLPKDVRDRIYEKISTHKELEKELPLEHRQALLNNQSNYRWRAYINENRPLGHGSDVLVIADYRSWDNYSSYLFGIWHDTPEQFAVQAVNVIAEQNIRTEPLFTGLEQRLKEAHTMSKYEEPYARLAKTLWKEAKQLAKYGITAPPPISIDIEKLKDDVEELVNEGNHYLQIQELNDGIGRNEVAKEEVQKDYEKLCKQQKRLEGLVWNEDLRHELMMTKRFLEETPKIIAQFYHDQSDGPQREYGFFHRS